MKLTVRLVVVAALAALGYWLWVVCFPSPEAILHKRLTKVAELVSFTSKEGQIARVGSNMILIIPGSTSEGGVHGGAGSARTLTVQDAEVIEKECSAVAHAAPVIRVVCQAVSELGNWSVPVTGTTPGYLEVRSWSLDVGRRLEPRDVLSAAKVCLIGCTTSEQLFGNEDPVGQRIRIDGTPVQIAGVLAEKGQNPLGYDEDDAIIVPITMCFRHLTGDNRCHALVVSASDERSIPLAMNQIRTVLRQRHQLRETELDDFTVKSIAEAAKAVDGWLLTPTKGNTAPEVTIDLEETARAVLQSTAPGTGTDGA